MNFGATHPQFFSPTSLVVPELRSVASLSWPRNKGAKRPERGFARDLPQSDPVLGYHQEGLVIPGGWPPSGIIG